MPPNPGILGRGLFVVFMSAVRLDKMQILLKTFEPDRPKPPWSRRSAWLRSIEISSQYRDGNSKEQLHIHYVRNECDILYAEFAELCEIVSTSPEVQEVSGWNLGPEAGYLMNESPSCGGIAPPFLTLALDGGKLSASCLGLFTTGEINPGFYWIGGWLAIVV
jgi:hypothetical protein